MNSHFPREDIQMPNRHEKIISIMMKMQIKTPLRSYLILCENNTYVYKQPEYVGRKRNPHQLLMRTQSGSSSMERNMVISQKIRIELPHDPVLPLLGKDYPNKKQSFKRIYAHQCSLQYLVQYSRCRNKQNQMPTHVRL